MMGKPRLTLDKEIITPPDIRAALEDWRTVNLNPSRWATFEAIQFEHERVVRVEWGYRHKSGQRDIAIQTYCYHLRDGVIEVTKLTHI